MTIIVTRDVSARYRGFLASCMLELVPGVYASPRLNTRVRERIWEVLSEWWIADPGTCIIMTWPNSRKVGGQEIRALGVPPISFEDVQDIVLARSERPPRPVPSDPHPGTASAEEDLEPMGEAAATPDHDAPR